LLEFATDISFDIVMIFVFYVISAPRPWKKCETTTSLS
jgi:hypothetical protein